MALSSFFKGNVGCIVDHELVVGYPPYSYSSPLLPSSPSIPLPSSTPDTSFYQWVPFVLILQVNIPAKEGSCIFPNTQAALFYIPRKIWKTCEGGLMASFGGF